MRLVRGLEVGVLLSSLFPLPFTLVSPPSPSPHLLLSSLSHPSPLSLPISPSPHLLLSSLSRYPSPLSLTLSPQMGAFGTIGSHPDEDYSMTLYHFTVFLKLRGVCSGSTVNPFLIMRIKAFVSLAKELFSVLEGCTVQVCNYWNPAWQQSITMNYTFLVLLQEVQHLVGQNIPTSQRPLL
jgi:hypothetical protein